MTLKRLHDTLRRRHLADRSVAIFVAYRLRWALAAILGLVAAATVAYVFIEAYSWLDALYMTVITLGTIGYGEVEPLTSTGRFLTIGVIIAGFATLVYTASALTELFASGDALRHVQAKRRRDMFDQLDDHVIIVGFGRVGQAVIRAVSALGRRCVVMDTNADHEAAIKAVGAIQVVGNATDEDDLRRAGIEKAHALVAAADQDSENLVVVLTARSLRPDMRIVSRVNQQTWLASDQTGGSRRRRVAVRNLRVEAG